MYWVASNVGGVVLTLPLATRSQPLPWIATLVASPVDSTPPAVITLSIEPTCVPRPTWSGFVPALKPFAVVPAATSWESSSENWAVWALYPTVSTLARLLAVTSSIV